VDVAAVAKGGAYLLVVLIASSAFTTWLAYRLTVSEDPVKNTELPPSKAEATARQKRPLPDPPLEALEDLRHRDRKNFHIYPPRAAEVYHDEKLELADLKAIEKALKEGESLFPVRKTDDAKAKEAPTNYGVQLPSRSSAGRKTTGGQ
jgi:hypothetical protein